MIHTIAGVVYTGSMTMVATAAPVLSSLFKLVHATVGATHLPDANAVLYENRYAKYHGLLFPPRQFACFVHPVGVPQTAVDAVSSVRFV